MKLYRSKQIVDEEAPPKEIRPEGRLTILLPDLKAWTVHYGVELTDRYRTSKGTVEYEQGEKFEISIPGAMAKQLYSTEWDKYLDIKQDTDAHLQSHFWEGALINLTISPPYSPNEIQDEFSEGNIGDGWLEKNGAMRIELILTSTVVRTIFWIAEYPFSKEVNIKKRLYLKYCKMIGFEVPEDNYFCLVMNLRLYNMLKITKPSSSGEKVHFYISSLDWTSV